jgi:ribosomal protein S1
VTDPVDADRFLATVSTGDILTGTVAGRTRSGTSVLLDGCPGEPLGCIGSLDFSWRSSRHTLEPGDRIAAEVLAVDPAQRRIMLSRAATENPALWAFLKGLQPGRHLSGSVAEIQRFGVFVDLDEGPDHPVFAGVGFVTIPELSWLRFDDPADVVSVGQRVTGEFLVFDTTMGEARLSLRATQPDPFLEFARTTRAGVRLPGRVTTIAPFGFFVDIGDGFEGLVRTQEQAVVTGDEVTVEVAEIDVPRRRLLLRWCR